MQCFRFMGMPDKVLAFDELPESMLGLFEMCKAEGFPRHWKKWLGTKKKITQIPPEKDFLTGGVRRYDPIVEEDSYFYLVDYNVKPVEEKWQEVCDYVRAHVDKEVRLMDRLDDMAKPLAPDKISAISLEPEDVIVIPLPKVQVETFVEKEKKPDVLVLKCDECDFEASGSYAKNSIRFHKQKKHKKTEAVV